MFYTNRLDFFMQLGFLPEFQFWFPYPLRKRFCKIWNSVPFSRYFWNGTLECVLEYFRNVFQKPKNVWKKFRKPKNFRKAFWEPKDL